MSFSIVVCKRDESSLSSAFWLNLRLHNLILTYHSRVECNLSGLRTHQMLWNILLMKSCKNLAILLVIAKLLYFINLIDGNLSTESRIFQKEANVVGVHLIVKRFKIFKSFYEKKKTKKKIYSYGAVGPSALMQGIWRINQKSTNFDGKFFFVLYLAWYR